MWIIIATQKFKGIESSRAFVKESKRQSLYLNRELHELGWYNIRIFEVDELAIDTLTIKY